MKIIFNGIEVYNFESEEHFAETMQNCFCPNEFGFSEDCKKHNFGNGVNDCFNCWEEGIRLYNIEIDK